MREVLDGCTTRPVEELSLTEPAHCTTQSPSTLSSFPALHVDLSYTCVPGGPVPQPQAWEHLIRALTHSVFCRIIIIIGLERG